MRYQIRKTGIPTIPWEPALCAILVVLALGLSFFTYVFWDKQTWLLACIFGIFDMFVIFAAIIGICSHFDDNTTTL